MPRKSGTKATSAKAPHATDGQPTRGGSVARGTKRRRTSNNVNTGSSDIYGTGTIVAANPFDDDQQPSHHHHQHHHQQHLPQHTIIQPQHTPPIPNSVSQIPNKMMPMPPQMHHIHHQHQQPTNLQHHTHLHHQPYPQHHQPLPNHHQMYSPNNQMQMLAQNHMPNPPGQHMQDHLGPPLQQPKNHLQMQQQGFVPPTHATQMIGTSTPPHIVGPAPSHSPYLNHPQPGSMMVAPPQAMTPQPPAQAQTQPHLEQMLMQQPYITTTNPSGGIFCGKCQREIYQNEPNIICKAGCRACFHISCSGLTQLACDLLMKESLAEWACDRCTSGVRRVPFIKYKT